MGGKIVGHLPVKNDSATATVCGSPWETENVLAK